MKTIIAKIKAYAAAFKCKLVTKETSCIYTFRASRGRCLKLQTLLTNVFPSKEGFIKKIFKIGQGRVGVLQVDRISLNRCKKTVSLRTVSTRGLAIYRPYLILKTMELDVTYVYGGRAKTTFTLLGTWQVGDLELSTTVKRDRSGAWFVEAFSDKPLSLKALLGGLVKGKMLGRRASSALSRGFNMGILDKISIRKATILARMSRRGVAGQLSCTVALRNLGSLKIDLNFERRKDRSGDRESSAIFMIGSKNIRLATAIKKLIKLDISRFPMFGTMSIPSMQFFYVTADMVPRLRMIPAPNRIIRNMKTITKGAHMIFTMNKGRGRTVSFHMFKSRKLKKLIFRALPGPRFTVREVIDRILRKMRLSLPRLPSKIDIRSLLNVPLPEINYQMKTKILSIRAGYDRKISLLGSFIQLKNITTSFEVSLSSRRKRAATRGRQKLGFSLSALWNIAGLKMQVAVSKPRTKRHFYLSGSIQTIPIGKLFTNFGKSIFPGFLKKIIRRVGLEGFAIKDAKVSAQLSKNMIFRLSGSTTLGSWQGCGVEVIVGKVKGSSVFALGISIKDIPVTRVVKKLTKIPLNRVPGASILDNTVLGIITSTQQITKGSKFRFNMKPLDKIHILEGFTVVGRFRLPSRCRGDKFCKILKKPLGRMILILDGRLSADGGMVLRATVPTQIFIARGFALSDIGLFLELGPHKQMIGLTATLDVKKPKLKFIGTLGVSPSGVEVGMSMKGWWHKVFGIPILHLGDMNLAFALREPPLFLTRLEIGGKMKIGFINKRRAKPFELQVYLGLDRDNPMNNYFFGKMSALTVPAILRAFAINPRLPSFARRIGFPKGLTVSFAKRSHRLRNGVSIPGGFYLKGVLQFLFLKVYAHVNMVMQLGVPVSLFVDVRVKPFRIARGLIAVEGARPGGKPRVKIDVGLVPPRARITIAGSLTILYMKRTVLIHIDEKGLRFHISGSFLNLFRVALDVTASYGSLKTADFRVVGTFKQDLFSRILTLIRKKLDHLKKQGKKHFKRAKAKVDQWKNKIRSVTYKMKRAEGKVRRFKQKFHKAANAIKRVGKKVWRARNSLKAVTAKMRRFENKVRGAKRKFDNAINSLRRKQRSCPRACRRKRKRELLMQRQQQ